MQSFSHVSKGLVGNVEHRLMRISFAPSSPAVERTCLVQVDSWVLDWPDCLVCPRCKSSHHHQEEEHKHKHRIRNVEFYSFLRTASLYLISASM